MLKSKLIRIMLVIAVTLGVSSCYSAPLPPNQPPPPPRYAKTVPVYQVVPEYVQPDVVVIKQPGTKKVEVYRKYRGRNAFTNKQPSHKGNKKHHKAKAKPKAPMNKVKKEAPQKQVPPATAAEQGIPAVPEIVAPPEQTGASGT